MARVFMGKVAIHADDMDDYLQAIADRSEEFKPLR